MTSTHLLSPPLHQDWKPETTLKHILQVIRCLLIVPFPESSLNDEAGKLFMDSYDEFSRRARIMTEVHALSEEEMMAARKASAASSAGGNGSGQKEVVTEVKKKEKKIKEAKKKSLKRL
jgi:ubiquitin-conjugating enzyme E2 S